MPLEALSGDRLIRLLAAIAVLLFVGRALLRRWRHGHVLAKWARWGAIAAFSAASLYALGASLRWALGTRR
jgi:hypothetical protein